MIFEENKNQQLIDNTVTGGTRGVDTGLIVTTEQRSNKGGGREGGVML